MAAGTKRNQKFIPESKPRRPFVAFVAFLFLLYMNAKDQMELRLQLSTGPSCFGIDCCKH